MHDRDCLHRFLFEHYPFRGQLVHVDAAWQALLEHRDYPAAVRDTLGEAVAASVLLAATLKFEGMLTLQLQGDGPMHLLLAQCSSGLAVRALARYRQPGDVPGEPQVTVTDPGTPAASTLPLWPPGNLQTLAGEGRLTVTLDTKESGANRGDGRYQGVVPLNGGKLQDCLQDYFERSEQLPTRLWLQADEHGASGLLLQRLPSNSMLGRSDPTSRSIVHSTDDASVDDAWQRVQLLGDTLKNAELKDLRDQEILHRLFAEDDVRLFEPAPVFFRCTCSRERVAGMLQSLGEGESRSILAEQGQVEVRCDFCNRAYQFDPVDVERLFAPGVPGEGGITVH
jgi:molecular chaperone Hsp33